MGATQVVVVGAGIGGLAAAAALARHVDEVIVLERDGLPDAPVARPGVPQGRHVHGLRGGGFDAFAQLLPGQGMSVAAQQAVLLDRLLGTGPADAARLAGAATPFFACLGEVLDDPWAVAAQDFGYAHLENLRPPGFADRPALS